jgi:hypothetical protein
MPTLDRHIAISAGWVAGPAAGIAIMGAPGTFGISSKLASEACFYGGAAVFLTTVVAILIHSFCERDRKHQRKWPIFLGLFCILLVFVGAAFYFRPYAQTKPASNLRPHFITLEDLFQGDFPHYSNAVLELRVHFYKNADAAQTGILPLKYKVLWDANSGSDFMAIYIPQDGWDSSLVDEVIHDIRNRIPEMRSKFLSDAKLSWEIPGTSFVGGVADSKFTGLVYVYTEASINDIQKGDLAKWYKESGMSLQIRGNEYVLMNNKH